jgi:hypothetical protein
MSIESDTQALYVMNIGENVLPKKIGPFNHELSQKKKNKTKKTTKMTNLHILQSTDNLEEFV